MATFPSLMAAADRLNGWRSVEPKAANGQSAPVAVTAQLHPYRRRESVADRLAPRTLRANRTASRGEGSDLANLLG